jgi:ABC-type polysaccharide/polyol phosphate transport system ATPase subunit
MNSQEFNISADGLWKTYHLFDRSFDRVKEALSPFRLQYHRDFHALRDVTFNISPGESLGIIGRNGSGKSTLLKILTGVLTPSAGQWHVKGKVSSLLELGSGFNPELSGHENIFMQGTFQGYTRKEIEGRYDEIAAFADIGQFLHQPVKMYSSGMFVRLAFSCATVISPDVLIIDEALAVGDGAFVHKCMARISKMVEQGASLVLVTHDIETVKRFCKKGLWLDSGIIKFFGPAGKAGDQYYAFIRQGKDELLEEDRVSFIPNDRKSKVNFTLPRVNGIADLKDNRLFRESPWDWIETNSSFGKARVGSNAQSAQFAFFGDELELTFGRGGVWGDPEIWIDGISRPYAGFAEFRAQGDLKISVLRFSVLLGEHEVQVLVSENSRPILWLFGKTCTNKVTRAFKVYERFLHHDPTGQGRHGNQHGRIVAADLVDEENGDIIDVLHFKQRFQIRIWAESYIANSPLRIGFGVHIKDKNQNWVFGATNWDGRLQLDVSVQKWYIGFSFENVLNPGDYAVLLSMAEAGEDLTTAVHMDVIETALYFRSRWTPEHSAIHGLVHIPCTIETVAYKDS